jgi:deoxyribose-phosphate aldolase
VNSSRVVAAAARLEEAQVKTVALIGFPLGAMDADAKRYEAELAFDLGAQEVEVVVGLGQVKDGDARKILRELRDIVSAADESPVGMIIESAQLSPDELKLIGEVIPESGVQRVCTSTDFWPDARVTAERLQVLREAMGAKTQLKATGGVRDLQLARALLAAGAALIGTTSVTELTIPSKN